MKTLVSTPGFFYGIIIYMDNEVWVYESPDGGHTVYRRKPGKTNRELFSVDQQTQDKLEGLRQDKLWGEIRRQSQTDAALKDLLNQAEIYYHMKYDEKS